MRARSTQINSLAKALLLAVLLSVGCEQGGQHNTSGNANNYDDGTYRGGFFDRDEIQVVVEVTLKDNTVTQANFRHLSYSGVDYLGSDNEAVTGIGKQYKALLKQLIDNDIDSVLPRLYEPGELLGEYDDVDGVSAATIRSAKVISAIRDALNRGIYSHPDH
ncbi:FMN-binding protein [Halorhodospira halochloris]|uniref:FMN-binding protein n=1 Tax=Halorhodospira halochloris TaxID=1052 RepID=UPI000BBABB1B|nr:FMN-binding protein [Halorhodospira halochloris]MBK1652735.1 hypothetical protein [Halorhodospira halochloris]MCG5531356.1 FMN-binding protein [Halorhodospira halochloris]MCG5549325.1 FMN-binding protein [Halorhodospira halochloris]